jgi:hypothetical protein
MKTGDLIEVQTFSEGVVRRRVVEIKGDTVYICLETEWEDASKQGREPECVGFNKRYVAPASRCDPVTAR